MKNVNNRIEVIKAQLAIAHKMFQVTKSFVGKTVNKRIQTVAREQMGQAFAVVYTKSDWGSWEVKVWGNGLGYSDMFTLYMGSKEGYGEMLNQIDQRIVALKQEQKELEKYSKKDIEQFISFAKSIKANIDVIDNLPFSIRQEIKAAVGNF